MTKLMAIILVALVLSGCDTDAGKADKAEQRAALIKVWDLCIERGGIPIQHSWLGYPVMSECVMLEEK